MMGWFKLALIMVVALRSLRRSNKSLKKNEELAVQEINDDIVGDHLMTGFLPKELRDPELVVRTSVKNGLAFLYFGNWPIANYIYESLIPDFDGDHLEATFLPTKKSAFWWIE